MFGGLKVKREMLDYGTWIISVLQYLIDGIPRVQCHWSKLGVVDGVGECHGVEPESNNIKSCL